MGGTVPLPGVQLSTGQGHSLQLAVLGATGPELLLSHSCPTASGLMLSPKGNTLMEVTAKGRLGLYP